jgi:hypothetical protein
LTRRRSDARLGAVVLAALLALVGVAVRLDGPIRAGGLLPGVLAQHNADGMPGGLGLLDEPCALRVLRGSDARKEDSFRGATYAVCSLIGGAALGFRLDRTLELTIRPALELPGVMRVGGPLAAEQGVLLYEPTAGTFRFTTSRRRARSIASAHASGGGPLRAWLVYGHAAWPPGQLEGEVAAGLWGEATLPP